MVLATYPNGDLMNVTLHSMVFTTKFGLCRALGRDGTLVRLGFGHATESALASLDSFDATVKIVERNWNPLLRRQLVDYFAGKYRGDFHETPLDSDYRTDFQKTVDAACRAVPYGTTRTYGELALLAGHPGAARAVGSCMATNRYPILIPCHRIVRADGVIGHYSALGGNATKTALLRLEQAITER